MGGGVMDGSFRDMADEVEELVVRLGRLPDAPLAMPKQRLETPRQGLIRAIAARLGGRGTLSVGDARHSGH
jgi:hypothetical protein